MYSKNPQDGVGTSPGATNSWKKKKNFFTIVLQGFFNKIFLKTKRCEWACFNMKMFKNQSFLSHLLSIWLLIIRWKVFNIMFDHVYLFTGFDRHQHTVLYLGRSQKEQFTGKKWDNDVINWLLSGCPGWKKPTIFTIKAIHKQKYVFGYMYISITEKMFVKNASGIMEKKSSNKSGFFSCS